MELKRVVVTGLGALTPVGNNVAETWENLVNGVSGAGPITHFDASKFKTQFACEVKNFKVNEYLDRKEARKMDLYTQYAIVAAKEAIEDAAMDLDKEDKTKIGVIYGVGIGGIRTFEEEMIAYAGVKDTIGPKFNPFFIPKMIADIASGHISIMYGFHGPNFTTTSACASSSNAIADAFNYIRLGKANVIVAGGAEAAISPGGVGGFNAMHALSTRNDDPQRASRPFSASRDGFIMAEGAGIMVLEEYEHAIKRGANIIAEVVGYGNSCDAYHYTAPRPDGTTTAAAVKQSLQEAGYTDDKMLYINAHGTSTPLNDKCETVAFKLALGEQTARKAMISSSKSMTGHMLGATGAVELIVSALALQNGILPPTIGYAEPDPECDLDYIPNQARDIQADFALSSSLGFGGHNACVTLKRYCNE